jgi:hypothetical protein
LPCLKQLGGENCGLYETPLLNWLSSDLESLTRFLVPMLLNTLVFLLKTWKLA